MAGITVEPDAVEVIEQTPPQNDSELRWLADNYMQIQRTRIAMENRLRSHAQGVDGTEPSAAHLTVAKLIESELLLQKEMNKAVKDHPAWPWLSQVKGVSGVLGCKLLGLLEIEKAPCPSSFWKFCGMGVTNGERDKPTKGEKLTYSIRAKTVCYLIATSFMRCGSSFRAIYDEARVHYDETHPEWTDGHKHNAALRKMEKVFLSCLWQVWREAEGLPMSLPYAHAHLGHVHLYRPKDFI